MAANVVVDRDGAVAVVRLNRPEAMNALDIPARQALLGSLAELARDPQARAVVLTGAGRAFCAGADLKAAAGNPERTGRSAAHTLLHDFQPLLECIMRMDKPVIAAVNGAAAGIGMSLVLACDLVVMDKNAYLKSPFVAMGLVPDGGAAWFLSRRIGYGRAFEALAESQRMSAERCLQWGVANRIESGELLEKSAVAWASELAALPPLALTLTKRIARLSLTASFADALATEAEFQAVCAASEDSKEAISAFAQKRQPVFKGR